MGSLLKETCSLCLAFPRFIIIIYLPDLRDQVHLVRIADSVKSPVNWQFQDLFQLTDHIATKLIIPWIMLSVQRWNTPSLDQLSDHSSMFVLPRYIDRPTKKWTDWPSPSSLKIYIFGGSNPLFSYAQLAYTMLPTLLIFRWPNRTQFWSIWAC